MKLLLLLLCVFVALSSGLHPSAHNPWSNSGVALVSKPFDADPFLPMFLKKRSFTARCFLYPHSCWQFQNGLVQKRRILSHLFSPDYWGEKGDRYTDDSN